MFGPDSRRFFSLGWDHGVRVWNMPDGEVVAPPVWEPMGHARFISPDGRRTLMLGSNNTVSILDAITGRIVAELPHPYPVHYGSFSPDGRTIITGCGYGRNDKTAAFRTEVFLWDSSGRRLNVRPVDWPFMLSDAAFNQDGSRVLLMGPFHVAQVFDIRDGRAVGEVVAAETSIMWGKFSSSGESVAATGPEGIVQVWNLHSGDAETALLQHSARVADVAWSGDGRRLHTATFRHRQVWDIATSQPLTAPVPIVELAASVVDESRPASDLAREPLLIADQRPVDDLIQLAQMFALAQVDANGNQVRLDFNALVTSWNEMHRKYPREFLTAPVTAAEGKEHSADIQSSSSRSRFAILDRDQRAGSEQVDLSSFYNRSLHQSFSRLDDGNTLTALPSGLQTFGGVNFDVRGTVLLSGKGLKAKGNELPQRVNGISLGRRCRRLHFLQAMDLDVPGGTHVGAYVLHYADGQTHELPLIRGRDLKPWWGKAALPQQPGEAVAVWNGSNRKALAAYYSLRLFKSTRENPRPDVEITSIDFVSTMTEASPFLVALTLE